MRDLLPPEAFRHADLGRRLVRAFELHGYELVTPPLFEFAEVMERGLSSLDPHDVLRFVEPESGAVVSLRPDMTPQIARLVATRLGDAEGPVRLCYQGSVLRRLRERARRHRQIPQAGFELVGRGGPHGDLELLAVAAAAARSRPRGVRGSTSGTPGSLARSSSRCRRTRPRDILDALEVKRERGRPARSPRQARSGRPRSAVGVAAAPRRRRYLVGRRARAAPHPRRRGAARAEATLGSRARARARTEDPDRPRRDARPRLLHGRVGPHPRGRDRGARSAPVAATTACSAASGCRAPPSASPSASTTWPGRSSARASCAPRRRGCSSSERRPRSSALCARSTWRLRGRRTRTSRAMRGLSATRTSWTSRAARPA